MIEVKSFAALRRFSPDKLQKLNLFETERFFCDVYCLEPGQEQKAHAHAGSDKLYAVLEGSVEVRVGAETREAARRRGGAVPGRQRARRRQSLVRPRRPARLHGPPPVDENGSLRSATSSAHAFAAAGERPHRTTDLRRVC